MGVMRLFGRKDPHARASHLASDPERFKIGQRAARSEVAKIFCPAEHGGESADCLDLHLRAGAAAVARMIVGIDLHGEGVGGAGQRMRRLEHLPGIEGMEVGVVVAEAVGDGLKNGGYPVAVARSLKAGKRRKFCFEQLSCAG